MSKETGDDRNDIGRVVFISIILFAAFAGAAYLLFVNNEYLFGLSVVVVIYAFCPNILKLLGARELALGALKWHGVWTTSAIFLTSIVLYVSLVVEPLISDFDRLLDGRRAETEYRIESLIEQVEISTSTAQSQPEKEDELKNLADLQRIRFEFTRLYRELQILFISTFRDVLNSVSTARMIASYGLIIVFALKILQILLARMSATRQFFSTKPVGPPQTPADPLAPLNKQRRWLVRELLDRARRTRARGAIVLIAINLLILGGIVSIYLAGDLVTSDAQQTTRLAQIQLLINGYKEEADAAEEKLTQTEAELAQEITKVRRVRRHLQELGQVTPDIDAALQKVGAKLHPTQPFVALGRTTTLLIDAGLQAEAEAEANNEEAQLLPGTTSSPTDKDEVSSQTMSSESAKDEVQELDGVVKTQVESLRTLAELHRRLEILQTDLTAAQIASTSLEKKLAENVDNYLVDSGPKKTDIALLVASGITRFGILVVVIFLVQILVGVYRYSLRLAAFYSARADALTAGVDRKTGLGDWGVDFMPDTIDFGRHPIAPAQYVVDAINAYFARRDSKKTGKKADAPDENKDTS
ncbi:MAG: hypothetical protein RIE06_31400 [Roseibium album]|uniref:hypothetical protein n=1 Tax=Roseibium album TaxID=311410 RepID=UPI0032EBAAF3